MNGDKGDTGAGALPVLARMGPMVVMADELLEPRVRVLRVRRELKAHRVIRVRKVTPEPQVLRGYRAAGAEG